MNSKPKILFCLDEPLLEAFILEADRNVVYASPSISVAVAQAIVKKNQENSQISISVILDPNVDPIRLGFGEIGGLKMLQNNGIDIRSQPGLRIGVVIVDDRSWMFTPTPEIILEKPEAGTINAINVNMSFAKWLMYAIAPRQGYLDRVEDVLDEYRAHIPSKVERAEETDSDDSVFDDEIIESKSDCEDPVETNSPFSVRDIEPEIGLQLLSNEQLLEIEEEVEANPPKKFDQAREMLVYNGYLQFVEMNFTGGRLASRTIRLPDHLLDLVKDKETEVEIKTTCRLFENIEEVCPQVKDFEKRVNEVRRCYTKPLGNELGWVILTKHRENFDLDVKELFVELEELSKVTLDKLDVAIGQSFERLVNIFVPLLLEHPNRWLKQRFDEADQPVEVARQLMVRILNDIIPNPEKLVERMELRCITKDVTWEMLNEKNFGDAIKKCFPHEQFTKLYQERQAIGERKPKTKRKITSDDWPEELNSEPYSK